MVEWPQRRRVVRFAFGRLFFGFFGFDRIAHTRADSPRMVAPVVSTGARMPGSFGCDDDDEEEAEVDDLILGIRKLGVKEGRD